MKDMNREMKNLKERDKRVIWHPFDQAKHTEIIPIVSGEGAFVYDDNGKRYIDGFSSWWVNLHGHAHPVIGEAIAHQAKKMEHVAFGGFTHLPAIEVAEKLLDVLPDHLSKVFFSDNGSTANEVAIKIALHYYYNKGHKRNRIIALENGYHGDTFGGMSVTGRGTFTRPFEPLLFDVDYLPLPTKENRDMCLQKMNDLLEQNTIAAFIFEPLVQGAGGMTMYDAEVLDQLIKLCKDRGVLTIADEVMTGFGRLGKYFAIDFLQQKPEIICLSKGITGGFMPLGVTVVSEEIFMAFYGDHPFQTFLHGHSYTGNALACAAASANLSIMQLPETWLNIQRISAKQAEFHRSIVEKKGVNAVRSLGTILAIELASDEVTSYFNPVGKIAYSHLLDKGIIMRPLGNVLVFMPPYCTTDGDLDKVYQAIIEVLDIIYS
jgi:adenosylmethionine---8-amino-7-oxononanoate aminotransferase